MKFVVVGISHEFLNVDERKNFYFAESDKLHLSVQLLNEYVHQVLILSTCNRSEVYAMCDDSFDENILKDIYLSYFHQRNDHVYIYKNENAIEYLLEVACGLQSMVLGEDQILHQIKDAMAWTMEQNFSGKEMNYVFQNVIHFAKNMRNTYSMNDHPLSVSYIGYQHISSILQPHHKIMICGIGEMSQLMIKYLEGYSIYIVNRNQDKVLPFLNEKRKYIPFEERYQYLNDVDIVISATSSPHVIFEYDKVNLSHSILFLDLAVPRDIDVSLKEHEYAKLIDMDDLREVSKYQLNRRKEKALMIKEKCKLESQSMYHELSLMKGDHVIKKMQQNYLEVSESTYKLLVKKIDLNKREQYILKKVLNTAFLGLLKDPVRLLKSGDLEKQQQYLELYEQLFMGRIEK